MILLLGKFWSVAVINVIVVYSQILTWGAIETQNWERYAAQLRATGQPVTFEDIEARRPEIPDDQNGCLVVERLADELGEVEYVKYDVFFFSHLDLDLDPPQYFCGIPERAIGPSRAFVEKYRHLLKRLDSIRSYTTGRLEPVNTEDPFGSYVRDYWGLHRVREMIRLSHAVKLFGGDIDGATKDALLVLHIGSLTRDEPGVFAHLRCGGLCWVGLDLIENTLRVGESNARDLGLFAKELDRYGSSNEVRNALLGERAFFISVCDGIAAGTLALPGQQPEESKLGLGLIPDFSIRQNQILGVRLLTTLLNSSYTPVGFVAASKRFDEEVEALPAKQWLAKLLLRKYESLGKNDLDRCAMIRCTQAAVAAERYRMEHGGWHSNLEDCVPEYLTVSPFDPYDGKPLRMIRRDDGIVIYGLGRNGIDDGGTVSRGCARYARMPDMGMRLLDPEHRGFW